jgi:hypothetical protein
LNRRIFILCSGGVGDAGSRRVRPFKLSHNLRGVCGDHRGEPVLLIMCRLEAGISMSDDGGEALNIQNLSDAQLIQILQHHDFDDDITRMVEAEIARKASRLI